MAKINFIYKKEPSLIAKAKEVVKIVNDRPHLLLRIEVRGSYFPHRAMEPVVRIFQGGEDYELCWFAEVSEDNAAVMAYFPVDVGLKGTVEYGYGNVIHGSLAKGLEEIEIDRLDRERLEKETVITTKRFLEETIK